MPTLRKKGRKRSHHNGQLGKDRAKSKDGKRQLAVSTVSGEGIVSQLNNSCGYIWSSCHGSLFFQSADLDASLGSVHGFEQLADILCLGDRVRYRATSQKPRNGCAYKCSWVGYVGRCGPLDSPVHFGGDSGVSSHGGSPVIADCFNEAMAPELTRGVGIVTNAFKQGFGFIWSEQLGRVYFTKDSYEKRALGGVISGESKRGGRRQHLADGENDGPRETYFRLKDAVAFDAVPQHDFSPSCRWRAVSLRHVATSIDVQAPSIFATLAIISHLSRAWGSLESFGGTAKVFFTLSDYCKRSNALCDVLQVGQVVDVAFVAQPESNGFVWRAVHVKLLDEKKLPDSKRSLGAKDYTDGGQRFDKEKKGNKTSPIRSAKMKQVKVAGLNGSMSYSQAVKVSPKAAALPTGSPGALKPLLGKDNLERFRMWQTEQPIARLPAPEVAHACFSRPRTGVTTVAAVDGNNNVQNQMLCLTGSKATESSNSAGFSRSRIVCPTLEANINPMGEYFPKDAVKYSANGDGVMKTGNTKRDCMGRLGPESGKAVREGLLSVQTEQVHFTDISSQGSQASDCSALSQSCSQGSTFRSKGNSGEVKGTANRETNGCQPLKPNCCSSSGPSRASSVDAVTQTDNMPETEVIQVLIWDKDFLQYLSLKFPEMLRSLGQVFKC